MSMKLTSMPSGLTDHFLIWQHTSIISVKISAEDCMVKKYGDFVEIYLGNAITDAPGVNIPVGPFALQIL